MHVRGDIVYGSPKGLRRVYVDLFGLIFFLLPVMGRMVVLNWPLHITFESFLG